MDNIAGVILAGGKSSRMGQDKATLIYKEKPLAEYLLEVLNTAGLEESYINNDSELADIIPDKGPLGGIYSALQKLSDKDYIFFVPVDMPKLTPKLTQKLIQSIGSEATVFEGHIFPLILSNSDKLNELLDSCINNKKSNSVKWLLEQLEVKKVPITAEDEALLINTNTIEEWEKLKNESTL
jgi:molybdopterin-guanine dinucleotide biosynthesis protein A